MYEAVKSVAEWQYENVIRKNADRLYGAVMCDEKAYGYDPDAPASAPAEED